MVLKYKTVRPCKKEESGVKTYEYEYDHTKYYEHYKAKKGSSVCPICSSEVSNIYLVKHQKTSKKCKKAFESSNEKQLLEQELKKLQELLKNV